MPNNTETLDDRTENALLNALRPEDQALLTPFLKVWNGKAGTILHRPGDDVRHVYFPCGPSLVSFRVELDDGSDVETLLVGREGAAGGIVSHGRAPAYARAVVMYSGRFLRMAASELEGLKRSSLTLRNWFDRYADCLLAQVFQGVACNAAHGIEQRAAKWLLAAVDRTGENRIPLTQEQLAGMLGVGRSYVNRIIRSFRERGLVETRRGSLHVQDTKGLGRLACTCNADVRRHFDQVLKGVYPGIGSPR